MYGLAARAVRISADGLTYRYLLRPEARFHDGTQLTAHDVAFSLTILKEKGHPIITQLLRDFAGAEAADDATVVLRFAPKRARDVPLFVAGLPIFSRAYYSQAAVRRDDARRAARQRPLQGRPLRARPLHRIRARARTGGAPICRSSRGQNNFDTVRYEYYRDRDVGVRRLHRARAICSARSSPRASGRRATTSRRSRTAASSAR